VTAPIFMSENLETTNCLLCGGAETQVLVAVPETPARIVRCVHDGFVFVNPRYTTRAVRELHTGGWADLQKERFDIFRRKILEAEAAAIKRVRPAGGKLLDVGCATGTLFDYFAEPIWELYGLDLSRANVAALRTRINVRASEGQLSDIHYPDKFFDVVSMLDTFYYVPDPRTELREIRRILKPGGLLAIEIPGFNYRFLRNRGPIAFLLNRQWTTFDPASGHLYYWSGKSLRALLEKAGFRVVKVVAQQASLGRGGIWRLINDLHFLLARTLMSISSGRLSIAGKELYLAVNDPVSAAA